MSTYFGILTQTGEVKEANAHALGVALKITEMAVGDGGGTLPIPDRAQTALIGAQRRAQLNRLYTDPNNANWIVAEQVIPESEGGWWIRELGLYDADGDLVAVANCPPTYKPKLAEGSGRTQVIRMVLQVGSAKNFELKIDPSVVLATRAYVDGQILTAAPKKHSHPIAQISGLQAALDGKSKPGGQTYTGLHHFQASSVNWGEAPAHGIRVEMGGFDGGTWLVTGARGNVFKGGIQMHDGLSLLRIFTGDGTSKHSAELYLGVWNEASIPQLPIAKVAGLQYLLDSKAPITQQAEAVGSYAFAYLKLAGAVRPGETVAGSNISHAFVYGDSNGTVRIGYGGGTLPGTWRVIGIDGSTNYVTSTATSLFQRIA